MLDMQGTGTVAPLAISFPAGAATLEGRLFLPRAEPVAAVVINGATGVPQSYYRNFATWLAAERQMACLTFDYSDFGASARGHVRDSQVTMSGWALIDQPAARSEMRRRVPDVPLWVVGHSLGGMMMPLQDGIEDIARMICVASGLVCHTDHPWPYQALARAFWFGPVPMIVRRAGYLPGKALKFGPDLPAGVYWEWRDWCTQPASFYPGLGRTYPQADWGRSGAPVDMFAFADDSLMPPHAARKLAGLYGVNRVRHHVVHPHDHGLKSIGHLDAFRRVNAALWPRLVDDIPL